MKTLFPNIIIGLAILGVIPSLPAQSWEPQGVGLLPVNYGVQSIFIVSENVVWAVAWDKTINGPGVPSDHIIKVLKTTDGGINWNVYDLDEFIGRVSYDIFAFNENIAFITTSDWNSGIGKGVLKTENGGVTWESKLNGLAGRGWIRFFSSIEGVAIDRFGISTTENGGDQWTNFPAGNIPAYQSGEVNVVLNGASGTNSCSVIDDHIWFGTDQGRVFRSKNKSDSWEVFNTGFGINGNVESIAFKDTLNGIALNSNASFLINSLKRTYDGGETWNSFSSSGPLGLRISNIAYVPDSDSVFISVAGTSLPNNNWGSAYSIDFGQTWQSIDTENAYGGTQFLSIDLGWSSRGMVTGPEQATMYKWNPGILVGTEELINSDDYVLFPNPFTNSIFMESGNGDFKIKSFHLYGLNGKLIDSGPVNESKELNFDDLNPGIYHLELIGDDFRLVREIVKVD